MLDGESDDGVWCGVKGGGGGRGVVINLLGKGCGGGFYGVCVYVYVLRGRWVDWGGFGGLVRVG